MRGSKARLVTTAIVAASRFPFPRLYRSPGNPIGKSIDYLDFATIELPGPAYIQDVLINGGVHMHGIVMVPKTSRLKESFDVHIEKNKTLYLIENEIRRIDVKPIKYASDHVTLYSGKAVVKRRFGYDDILVLC